MDDFSLQNADVVIRAPSLTFRENQVLQLASAGKTDKQIGQELSISRDTVASYWRRILLKYRAASRTEVVAKHSQLTVAELLTQSDQENRDLLIRISEEEEARRRVSADRKLLAAISKALQSFVGSEKSLSSVFCPLLRSVIELSGSEFAFVSEVDYDEGEPYLRLLTVSVGGEGEGETFFDRSAEGNFEFKNMRNLMGLPVLRKSPIISNDVSRDPRSGGVPPGHPPIASYLGLPIIRDEEVIGLFGVANRPGPYTQDDIDFLEPLLSTIGTIIIAAQAEHIRAQQEERLRDSVSLIQSVLDHFPNPIVFQTPDRVIRCINQAFCNLAFQGRHPNEIVGHDAKEEGERAIRELYVNSDEILELRRRFYDLQEPCIVKVEFKNGALGELNVIIVRKGESILGYLVKITLEKT